MPRCYCEEGREEAELGECQQDRWSPVVCCEEESSYHLEETAAAPLQEGELGYMR